MQTKKFEMPSGATLVITIAPFTDAWALMKASLKALKGIQLTSDSLQQEATDIFRSPAGLSLILNHVVEFATSPEVEVGLWKCANRAMYIPAGSPLEFPGYKVEPGMFDDPVIGSTAREDYPKIVVSLMEVNCKPFLVKALSGLLSPSAPSLQAGLTTK